MKKGSLIYLAAPYSHKSKKVMHRRFIEINKAAAIIMGKGYYVFSPISHTHPIAIQGDLPRGWEFWEGYDNVMIAACGQMAVLQLDGWDISTGVTNEIKIAKLDSLPLYYLDPYNPSDWPFE